MKVIKYIKLFNYILKEEESSIVGVCRVIQKIRLLPDDLKLAVWDVIEGVSPSAEYNDVSLDDLINEDKMKPVRAILMLDWIRREPGVAIRYMETERYSAPQTITDEDREMLRKVLDKASTGEPEMAEDNRDDIEINVN